MGKFEFLLSIVTVIFLLAFKFSNGKVMMEYIGASGKPITFNQVPIKDGIDFHFILGFAIDANSSGYQNGEFSPYWLSSLTPASVAAIKAKHSNVKVMASLSGWSLDEKVLHWYNPRTPRAWISTAFSSLQSLVSTYHLDGIDVDYESFARGGHSNFAYCIGELITYLKNGSVISVVSIAPFYNTTIPYIELFKGYGDIIDYVNYQFYTDNVLTPKAYLERFRIRAAEFDKNKLLPAYEVNGRGIQGDTFFSTLELLEESGFVVNGVMIYSADASSSNAFYYEKKSQAFLLNTTSI